MKIVVGARKSPLSQIQVDEVERELQQQYPEMAFQRVFVETTGDLDLKTSLLSLEKTNFFTKEIDELLLQGKIDAGIHSAKDLPEPLPSGLELAALTEGVDPSDVLVMREGMTLATLPKGAKIGTSSLRRIQMLQQIRGDCIAVDIRGTIGRRLTLLEEGVVDALIMAEAALIRLGLHALNRIKLEGEVAPHQGKLAVVICASNLHLKQIFSCLDSRTYPSKKFQSNFRFF